MQVARRTKHLPEDVVPGAVATGLGFLVELLADSLKFVDDDGVVVATVAQPVERLASLLTAADLEEPTRRLRDKEAANEDEAGDDKVETGRRLPLQRVGVGDVERSAVVDPVAEKDADVDGGGEDAHSETTNGTRGNLDEVGRSADGRHTDSQTSDEATSQELREVAVTGVTVDTGEPDDGADDPENACHL